MSTEALLVEKNDAIVTLTINRPDARNPLGEPGDAEIFAAACDGINSDPDVRCVILTGAGNAFSAGGNIKAMRDKDGMFAGSGDQIADNYRRHIHGIVRSLWTLEVPLIAAVNGPAVGLGNDVACLADMRIASDKAVFGATFLKVGLVPGDGGAWLLPRVIGMARACELLFTGQTIDAQTAQNWGLVNRVVLHEELMVEANELAQTVAAQPPAVLRMTKRLLRTGQTADFGTLMDLSASMQALAHQTNDHMEALNALFDKRPPGFTGS